MPVARRSDSVTSRKRARDLEQVRREEDIYILSSFQDFIVFANTRFRYLINIRETEIHIQYSKKCFEGSEKFWKHDQDNSV